MPGNDLNAVSYKDIITWSLTFFGWFINAVLIWFAARLAYNNGLRSEKRKREEQIADITAKLQLSIVPQIGEGMVIDLYNHSIYPMHDATVYLTIDHNIEDILHSENSKAFIDYLSLTSVRQNRVVWALRENLMNPSSLIIRPHENMGIALFRFGKEAVSSALAQAVNHRDKGEPDVNIAKTQNYIVVASEEGLGERGLPRVRLRKRDYIFYLKVISSDSNPRIWKLKYNAASSSLEDLGEIDLKELQEVHSNLLTREKDILNELRIGRLTLDKVNELANLVC